MGRKQAPEAKSTARHLTADQKRIVKNARTIGELEDLCREARLSHGHTIEVRGAWRYAREQQYINQSTSAKEVKS